ncbi:unnamed protein product [Onchocerca flexuosa]|uniref:MAGE domain-containing protein n=1 Tax=Onchocerca flexuosa TaxID=387005 RepID=A0A183GZX4_9BILA|nr:unnamed protein product [Onchocerca flexuosa]
MRFRGIVIRDEDEERKLEDQTAELAQLILYLQNKKKNCTKVSNIRMWEQYIDQTIDILDEIIGVKICFFKNQKLINSNYLLKMLCIFILNCDKAKYGLLIAILMFIYMMHRPGSLNYTVSENSLKNFLKEMDITENSCFGNQVDLNKLFGAIPTAEFISQGWLAFTKEMDESGHDIITYEWGPRAKSFIDPIAILRAYSTMDGSTLHHWRLHYQEPQTAAARNG